MGVLAVVVGVLVFLALRPPEPPSTVVTDSPMPTATETATPTQVVTPTAEPTPTTATPPPVASGRERPLDVLNANAAVRAVPGTCPDGGAQIETTTDGGASWTAVGTPTDLVMRVTWGAADDLWFVGAAAPECASGFSRSSDEGSTWDGPSDTTGAWHLLPDPEATQLHTPQGDVDSPCAGPALELESTSAQQAFVLCEDGSVFSTSDAGQSWGPFGSAPTATAMGVLEGQPIVALPGVADCTGVSLGPPGSEPIACVEDAAAQALALSFDGPGAGYLLAGQGTWVSGDGGETWTRSG